MSTDTTTAIDAGGIFPEGAIEQAATAHERWKAMNAQHIANERAAREAEMAAHPTRLYAMEGRGRYVKTCTLDGVDTKNVTAWADPVNGEAGIYPHDHPNGRVRLLNTIEHPAEVEAFAANPPFPVIGRDGDLFIVSGCVELTFNDPQTVAGHD